MASVKIKWTDPPDILTNEPCPAIWAGTVVVRKEGSAPRHRWDGTLIEDSTTRDEYSSNALVDSSLIRGKRYYYGIFPYDTKGDYRYTKIISLSSLSMEDYITVFTNGVFNSDVVHSGFIISNYKESKSATPGDSVPNYNTLAEYFLTEWGLLYGQYNGEPYFIENDYIRKPGIPNEWSSSRLFVPIVRTYNVIDVSCYAKTIIYDADLPSGAPDTNVITMGVGAIVNGEMVTKVMASVRGNHTEWEKYTLTDINLPYIDYISFGGSAGSPGYKDIIIHVSEV